MNTDHYARINDNTDLLNSLQDAWWKLHPGKSPRDDYSAYLKQSEYSDRHWMIASWFFVLTILLVVGTFDVHKLKDYDFRHIRVVCALFISAPALYFGISSCMKHPKSPNIWNAYRKDLDELIGAFPVIADEEVKSLQNAMREISTEIDMRARQIAAKQRAGFLVDANVEKQELLRLHEIPWRRFGIVKGLESFFPNDQAVG